eukprot:m51a1_g11855 hypothetical protein (188) ;mRNA; r:496797-497488
MGMKFLPLVALVALVAFVALQIAALAVVDWPSSGDVKDRCDSDATRYYSGFCEFSRSQQSSEALGIIACVAGGIALILCALSVVAEHGGPEQIDITKKHRVLGFIPKAMCFVAVVVSVVALIVWPSVYEHIRKDASDKYHIDTDKFPNWSDTVGALLGAKSSEAKSWLGCQIVASICSIVAAAVSFF